MSARSRALHALADHFGNLRDGCAGPLDRHAPSLYNAYEMWDNAADMARRSADEQTWRHRIRFAADLWWARQDSRRARLRDPQ